MSSSSQLQQRQHFSFDDDNAGDLADLDSDAQTISIRLFLHSKTADSIDLQIDYDDTIDRSERESQRGTVSFDKTTRTLLSIFINRIAIVVYKYRGFAQLR